MRYSKIYDEQSQRGTGPVEIGGGADGAREPFRLLQKQKLNLLFERPCIILYTHIFLDVPLPLMRGE
jgi:hypothetical protein